MTNTTTTVRIFGAAGLLALSVLTPAGANAQLLRRAADKTGDLAVYALTPSPEADEDAGQRLRARLLGPDVGEVYRSPEGVRYFAGKADGQDDHDTFEQNTRTGDIRFRRNMARYLGDYAPRLPGADEAQKLALTFLEKEGLLPAHLDELKLAHVGGLRATSTDGKSPGAIIDKLVTLSFGRVVDGLPVIGPGSKLVLDLGEGGEIVGLVRRWRELDADSRKPVGGDDLLSPREAYARALEQIREQFGEKSVVKIGSSGRAYFDNNGKLLQPVYYYQAQITLPDQRRFDRPIEYLCVVQMLRNSPEPLELTAVDPKAKERLRTVKPGEEPPTTEPQPRD